MREYNAVDDYVAIVFAKCFYSSLIPGRTVPDAFQLALTLSMQDEKVNKITLDKFYDSMRRGLIFPAHKSAYPKIPPFILLPESHVSEAEPHAVSTVLFESYFSLESLPVGSGSVQDCCKLSIPPGLPVV